MWHNAYVHKIKMLRIVKEPRKEWIRTTRPEHYLVQSSCSTDGIVCTKHERRCTNGHQIRNQNCGSHFVP